MKIKKNNQIHQPMPVQPEYEMCDVCDLQSEPCVKCLGDYIQKEIYKRVKEDHEGEITEDEFLEICADIKHEELDDEVNRMCLCDANRLVCEYGISKAIQLLIDNYGGLTEAPTIKQLVYVVVEERVDYYSYEGYIHWCEEN